MYEYAFYDCKKRHKMKIEKAKIFNNIYVYYSHTSDLCLNLIIHINLFYIFSYSYICDYNVDNFERFFES